MNRIVLLLVLALSIGNVLGRDIYVGGAGASDNNAGTTAAPYATIQKAASVAVAGDVVKIRSGTYRETITPANSGSGGNPIIYQPDDGATVIISGLEVVDNSGWTVHSGSIYKKTITLPVSGYTLKIASNTTIAANQVFKDGVMQMEARWPKVSSVEEMLDRSKLRPRLSTQAFTATGITDSAIPNIAGGWVGAKIWVTGWFISQSKTVTSSSGSSIGFQPMTSDERYLQFYYLTGKLGALTQAKEFHYENGTLYFWQEGGGSPSGIEFKARNWGFDLRGKSNITIAGVQFMGCEVNGDANTSSITVDNIRAKYMNHTFLQEGNDVIYYNANQTGFKLMGSNNVVQNSEFKYCASQGVLLGEAGRVENNLFEWMGYEGNYGAPVMFYGSSGHHKVLRNTIRDVGRSGIDYGNQQNAVHKDLEIGYNDVSNFGRLSSDGGGFYAARYQDLTGTVVHHNWIHNSKAEHAPSPWDVGINAGIYYDQATGSGTINHHNVLWDNRQCDIHISTGESTTLLRGKAYIYNNTLVTMAGNTHGHTSYLNVVTAYFDEMRNNIFRNRVHINFIEPSATWGDVKNSVMRDVDPQFVGGSTVNPTTIASPQDYFQIKATSPAKDFGITINNITDGSVNAPDAGAYEIGGDKWVPGYNAVTGPTPINTPPVVTVTAPTNGTSVAQGTAISITATATDANGSISRVEFYDGITKLGEDLTSPYSFSWTNAAAGTHSITAKATDNQNAVTTSAVISVTVTATGTPPAVSLTAPTNNAKYTTGANVALTATATDANGTVSKVEFYNGATKLGEDLTTPYTFTWNGVAAGNYVLTAKATDNQNNITTSAVVNISVTAAASAKPVVALTAPTNNAKFAVGSAINLAATATDGDGTISKVEFFNGTTKLGEDTSSPYTFSWSTAPVGTFTLTAQATDNQSNVTVSSAITITVNAQAKPVVTLTSPSNSAQFVQGTAITFSATATDPDGTISKVEFFNGTTKIGEDTSNPYSFTWSTAPVGTFTVTAKATDNQNNTTTSSAITVTVLSATNGNPRVSITSPAHRSRWKHGTALIITADASSPGGTVAKVEFFDGTTKLGEDMSSPYSFTWTDAPLGTRTLTAQATDNSALTATSAAIEIDIDPENDLPVAEITSPSNDSQFFSDNDILIEATATDDDGTITKVEFYAGTTKLGEDIDAPYTFNWTGVLPGSYDLTVIAYDQLSATGTSAVVNITVALLGTNAPESTDLYSGIPRFFSPNGDGTGDKWVWGDMPEYQNAMVRVYNRAGQEVYKSMSYDNSWDGTSDGRALQEGDYYYIVSLQNLGELKGSIRIIK